MKVVKTASGKQTLKLSRKEWQAIGKKAGWFGIGPILEKSATGVPELNVSLRSEAEALTKLIDGIEQRIKTGNLREGDLENLEAYKETRARLERLTGNNSERE